MAATVLNKRYLYLGLIPAALYFLLYWIIAETRSAPIGFALLNSFEAASGELFYRSLWISAFLGFSALGLAMAVSLLPLLCRESAPKDRRWLLVIALVVAAWAILLEQAGWLPDPGPWYAHLGQDLFPSIFAGLTLEGSDRSLLSLLDMGLAGVKAVGAIVLVFIGLAMVGTLRESASDAGLEEQLSLIATQLRRQKRLLHQSALLFVLAVVAMLAWMHWPMPFLVSPEDYRQVVAGAAVLQATCYSILIASLYLPAALVLRQRADRLLDRAGASEDLLVDEELKTRPLDHLRQIGAVLAPFMTALIPVLAQPWV